MEIQRDKDAYLHHHTDCRTANESMISQVARGGHMMWGNRLPPLPRRDWWDCCSKVDNDRLSTHSVVTWGRRLGVTDGACHARLPWGHCGLLIKAGLTGKSVGTWSTSAMSGQEEKVYTDATLDGRQSVVERPWGGADPEERNSGMADAASSPFPAGPPLRRPPLPPLRDTPWRDCVTDLLPETDTYRNVRHQQTKDGYIDSCLQQIVRAGT